VWLPKTTILDGDDPSLAKPAHASHEFRNGVTATLLPIRFGCG
jgi:hypothetical protein